MKHPMAVERVEDCPDPSYHDTFRYCPYCPWTDPDAPKSDAEVWRARAEAAEAERDAQKERADYHENLVGSYIVDLRAAEAERDALAARVEELEGAGRAAVRHRHFHDGLECDDDAPLRSMVE